MSLADIHAVNKCDKNDFSTETKKKKTLTFVVFHGFSISK